MLVNDIKELIPVIQGARNIAIGLDVETSGLDVLSSRLLLVQLSVGQENYVINYNKTDKKS